ncbi:hypothetical protein BH23PLA1_BH23PLA1_01240 [soil metagenome]
MTDLRTSTLWRTIGLGLCLSVLAGTSAQADREFPDDHFFNAPDNVQEKFDAMTGQPHPELSVTDWINGEFSPGELEGKVLVVDIWATWCGPCLAAIPKNNELAEKYADAGVLVIGVCSSTGQEKLAETVEARDIKYPVAKDPDNTTAQAWNVAFFPTYAVVDRKGTVRAIGLIPTKVEDVIKAILEEQPAEAEAQQDEDK